MYEINILPYFTKKLKKLVRNNIELKKKVSETILKLSLNPSDPAIVYHKVGNVWSSRVTGDIRIIWDYDKNQNITIILINIGGHSGNTSVY